jgi:hypothetical protein
MFIIKQFLFLLGASLTKTNVLQQILTTTSFDFNTNSSFEQVSKESKK